MTPPHAPATTGTPAAGGILPQALSAFSSGIWINLGNSTASGTPGMASLPPGWRALTLAPDTAGNTSDPLAGVADTAVQWMAVHDNALTSLASWQAGACRPLVVSIPPAALAFAGPALPAWQQALVRNGYVFTAEDEHCACFVRADQPDLQSSLAQLASRGWRARLQASSRAHAQSARAAEQARKAALQAQAQANATQAEVHALQLQLAALYASTSWKSTKPLRWLSRLARQPRTALRQLAAFGANLLRNLVRRAIARVLGSPRLRRHLAPLALRHPALLRRVKALLRPGTASLQAGEQAGPPAIHPVNMIGPQFKTLLIDELDHGRPPASHQG